MTSTDRAFIEAFRREATRPQTPDSPKIAQTTAAKGLPGVGVEVVSFAIPQRANVAESNSVIGLRDPRIGSPAGDPTAAHKLTLHGPHNGVAPITSLRRPLSSLMQEREDSEVFRPEINVSRLRWPIVCAQLGAENPDRLAIVLETLGRLVGSKTKTIGVAGVAQRVGCTTVTLALARQAARLGRRVAVLEADANSPSFTIELALSAPHGLAELIAEKATLPQITTYAHDERVAAITWGRSPSMALDARKRLQLSLAAGRLRAAFDLVLIDLGAVSTDNCAALDVFSAMQGDGVLLVACESFPQARLIEVCEQLQSSGCVALGVIENGTPFGPTH
jgi:Mrp family chromosome partitioning ATPase